MERKTKKIIKGHIENMKQVQKNMTAMDEESQCEIDKYEQYLLGYEACFNEILLLE